MVSVSCQWEGWTIWLNKIMTEADGIWSVRGMKYLMNNNDWTIYWLRLMESGQEESWTIWWLIMKKSSCILIVLTYHINLEKKACLCLIKDLQSSVETQSLSFIHESALSWTRYHQPQYLTFILWFIPLTDQIPSASVFNFHQMVHPSYWPDTISLSI